MWSAVENWVVPLLQMRLHASPFVIGQLTYIPFLASALIGPMLGQIIRFIGGNKRMVLVTGTIQMLALFGLLLPTFRPDLGGALPIAVTCAVAFSVVGICGAPAWLSWMADLIPKRVHGRFYSSRLQVFLVWKLVCTVLFAMLIDSFPIATRAFGIAVILIAAGVSKLISLFLFRWQPEFKRPPRRITPSARLERLPSGIFSFIRTSGVTQLGRWTMAYALMLFGVFAAGPYFAVYMLAESPRGLGLGESPYVYMILVQTNFVVRLLCYNAAGRLIDRFGAVPLLRVAMGGIMLLPLAWTCTTSLPLLILNEVFSGICWCLAESGTGVLLLTCGRETDRARLIGFNQTVTSVAVMLGALLGGTLLSLDSMPTLSGSEFRTLFLFSTLLRVPAFVLALRFLPANPALHLGDEMWRLIPGLAPAVSFSRGVIRHFLRP